MSDYSQNNLPSQSTSSFTSVFQETTGETEAATRNLALTIAAAASDRKAGEIILLKVTEVSYLADYFVMVTGYSRVQVRAIAQAIEDKVTEICHRRPLRSEGKAEGSWVVQDYGEVIVHTMLPKEREFYNLEAFWGHGERIEFPASISVGD